MDEPEVERVIGTVTGSVLAVVACFAAALVPVGDVGLRLAVTASAVALSAYLTADLAAMVAVAVVAFLIFDGFLVGSRGQLTWHGQDDVLRLGALMAAGLAGLALGTLRRWVRRERRFGPVEALLVAPPGRTAAAHPSDGASVPVGTGRAR